MHTASPGPRTGAERSDVRTSLATRTPLGSVVTSVAGALRTEAGNAAALLTARLESAAIGREIAWSLASILAHSNPARAQIFRKRRKLVRWRDTHLRPQDRLMSDLSQSEALPACACPGSRDAVIQSCRLKIVCLQNHLRYVDRRRPRSLALSPVSPLAQLRQAGCRPPARHSGSAVLEEVARVVEERRARRERDGDEPPEVRRRRVVARRVGEERPAQPVEGALRGELREACGASGGGRRVSPGVARAGGLG